MKSPNMFRGLLSFSSVTMISRVFGLARDISVSHVFGASMATDAFVIAFRIPNFMRRLFAEGSFSTAFVPVFTQVKECGDYAELQSLTARVAGTLGGILLIITAMGIMFAPQLGMVFAPGAWHQADKFALIIKLLRLTFPYLLFVSMTALASGVLNSFHRFGLPALTPVILNLCLIVGALWVAPHLQVPVMALGWAVLLAGGLQLLLLLPALRRLRLLSWPRWGWHHRPVRRIMTLMVPTLFGASVGQINLLLDTILISLLITGSQTWMYQATRFLELPLGVFGVALGTVILPVLSRHHVTMDRAAFSKSLDWGMRMALLITMPAMVALLLLAEPLISTFFQNGQYTAFDTRMTAWATMALSFGLPSQALIKVILPSFYARRDTHTPTRVALVSLLANMLFNVLLVSGLFECWASPVQKQLGYLQGIAQVSGLHVALAVATVLSGYLQFALLWRCLKRAGVYDPQPGWMQHWLRLIMACLVLMAVLLAGRCLLPPWGMLSVYVRAWHLALLVVMGTLVYVGTLFACGFRIRYLRSAP